MEIFVECREEIYLPGGAKDESIIFRDDVLTVIFGNDVWSTSHTWELTTEGPPRLYTVYDWARC